MNNIKTSAYDKISGSFSVHPIDDNEHPQRYGLEGPFRQKSGHIIYYDPKAGKYYDPKKDMYIEDDELMMMQNLKPFDKGSQSIYCLTKKRF